MERRTPLRLGMYAVQTTDSGDRAAPRDAAGGGRAAAKSRRRALAAGRSALPPAHERVRTESRAAERRAAAAAVAATRRSAPDRPSRPDLLSASSDTQRARGGTVVPANGVADARLGRALSMQRRRQLSQGKQALNGGGDRTASAAGAEAPAFIVYRGGGR